MNSCNFIDYICGLMPEALSSFSSIAEVGCGLYLALAVVQTISTGGLSSLNRRALALRTLITRHKLSSLFAEARLALAETSKLEIELETVNSWTFRVALTFLLFGVGGLVPIAALPNKEIPCSAAAMIITYYLGLPFLSLWVFYAMVSSRCSNAKRIVADLEKKAIDQI